MGVTHFQDNVYVGGDVTVDGLLSNGANRIVSNGIYVPGENNYVGITIADAADYMIIGARTTSSRIYFTFGSQVTSYIGSNGVFNTSSDDRLKKNEIFISDALQTLNKLRPQTYDKYADFEHNGTFFFESGLIAQEIYYDAPELRHLIDTPMDISGHINTSIDPTIDPDYSNWGPTPASVNYIGLIPYCIQAIKEQQVIIEAEKGKVSALEAKTLALDTQIASILLRLESIENR